MREEQASGHRDIVEFRIRLDFILVTLKDELDFFKFQLVLRVE